MPTLTIINSIKALSPAEQLFIIEQVLRCMREKGNQQAGFTEIGTDYIQGEEVANIPEISAGYMSLEEFRVEAKESLTKILNERGIY